jgi:hypothetical protein
MIISGSAPTGSAYLVLDASKFNGEQLSTSKAIGPANSFRVWGSVATGVVGGEANNVHLGMLVGSDGTTAHPGSAPPIGRAWTTFIFQRATGGDGGSIELEGGSWNRADPTTQAVPTSANSFSAPLDFSAQGSTYLLQLDPAAEAGDSYLLWGTNDSSTRSPASAAGATPLNGGQPVKGGGNAILVQGFDFIIAKCLTNATATELVAVATLNDGASALPPTPGPGTPWLVGGQPNGPGAQVLGTTDAGSVLDVKAANSLVMQSDGDQMLIQAPNGELRLLSGIEAFPGPADGRVRVFAGESFIAQAGGDVVLNAGGYLKVTVGAAQVFDFIPGTSTNQGPTSQPVGTAAGEAGRLLLAELAASGTNVTGFRAPDSLAADVVYTLPTTDGQPGDSLTTDGAGSLSWKNTDTLRWSASQSDASGNQYFAPGYITQTTSFQEPPIVIAKAETFRTLCVSYQSTGNTHDQTVTFELLDATLTPIPGATITGPTTDGQHDLTETFPAVSFPAQSKFNMRLRPSAALDANLLYMAVAAN